MKISIPLIVPIATKFRRNGDLRTTSESSADALRECFDVETLGKHPHAVYLNGTEEQETNPEGDDEKKRETLWRNSVAYVELRKGETRLKDWS